MTEKPYVCKYCNHGFLRESTLMVHVCEKKRRALAQHEKHVMIAFDTFKKFFKTVQNSKEKTYEDFCNSQYYTAFVKFGSYVSNVKPLYPDHFIKYIITNSIKLDHWCHEEVYDKYVIELLKRENVETALQRSISTMISWADAHNTNWDKYFHDASLSRAAFDIKDGKISPWLVLNCQSGKSMLKKFDDQQLNMINSAIDPQYWLLKFRRNPADLEIVTQLVKDANL